MRISTRNLALAASAVLTLAAGGVALAQVPSAPPAPPAPPMPPPPPLDMMMAGGPHIFMMRGHGDPAAHAQHLRDVLQLRPDQEGALKAYLEGGKPPAMKDLIKDDGPDGDDKAPLTTPERLDRQAARMSEMAATFQKRAAVTKAFYAALSPSQQKAFDVLGPEMGGPRMEVRRIETRHDGPGAGAKRKVIIERKAG
jgi:hypothetical protein